MTSRAVLRYALTGDRRGRYLVGASVGLTGHQVAEAAVPVVVGVVIDQAVATGDAAALGRWLTVLAVVFVGLLCSWRFAARAAARVTEYGAHDVRMAVARRALDPHGTTPRRMPGELVALATSDAQTVARFTHTLGSKLAAAAAIVTAAVALLVISVPLGLLVLLGTPPVLIAMQYLSRPLERRSEHDHELAARAGAVATDLLTGLRVLDGIGARSEAARRYRRDSRAALAATLRTERAQAWYTAANTLLTGGLLALIALVGAHLAARGRITVGELVTVVGLAQFLQGPLVDVAYFASGLGRARASARRVVALLTSDPAVGPGTRSPASAVPGRPVGHVRADGLGVGGLIDVGFVVEPGEFVGIVTDDAGHAEALVDVLARRRDPDAGALYLDGVSVAELDPDDLRRTVVAPPHDAALFAGTIADNVGRAEPRAVRAALAAACVDEDIAALPAGLDTTVTEQGLSLSGGQRQRLALARALATRAAVLVLHDPTTSVDTVTEARIAAGLRADRVGRTTILVTTSPTLLAVCDRVMVLAADVTRGTTGTHAQLAAVSPGYRELVLA
ncbi:ABC transporter transmembrane domain-containing protein [Embleya scabrispora]|uniref:ABC transporter transmembrane domain-containing protein n=1 Tax=Embleya scabrispora TaxID=159449 RepID=UPI001F30B808|nr:ABC transporter ATP-binding protein [Embleya scabrispora]